MVRDNRDMGASQLEIERKYEVGTAGEVPELVGAGPISSHDAAEVYELDATYFDTAGLDLARRHIAVRRREGGHDAGWHIKWPPADEGRTEQHFPLTADASRLPSDVREALAGALGNAPVAGVARVQNRRVATVWRDASGTALIEFADDHVTSTDLRDGAVRRWQEWEVELLDGAPGMREGRNALLDAVEERLSSAGAVRSHSASKLARALGLLD